MTKRLANLQTSLDTIHKEEVAVIGGDMDSLVAELGGDEDLREIMDSIVESADEIKGIEQSISNLSAVAEGLEREGADYRARYAAERRVTNKVEQVLEIQKAELEKESQQIKGLLARIKDVRSQRRTETEDAIHSALETPMQHACASVIQLLGSAEESGNIAIAMPLSKVLKQISASNMYQTKFRFDDEVDDNTRRWLADTFAPHAAAMAQQPASEAPEPAPEPESQADPAPESAGVVGARGADLPMLHFDQFPFQEDELAGLVRGIFDDFNLFEEFRVARPVFDGFMDAMRMGYKSENPYHNYRHAIDVTQMSYYFCKQTSASEILTKWDIFLLLVCCVAHDVDHNGLNNGFHQNTQSALALMYNDISIMENHHSSYLLKTILRAETNLFENCDIEQKKNSKQAMVDIILSTDMTNHFDVTNKFKLKVDAGIFGDKDPETGCASEEDRSILSNLLMHAADLSNAVRPFPTARKWAYDITEEFCAQGDLETKLGLPVSPLCGRADLTTDVQKAKMQIGFLDFVVTPMYKHMATFITGMEQCLDNVEANRALYVAIKDGEMVLEDAEAKGGAEAAERAAASPARPVTEEAAPPEPTTAEDDDVDGDDV